MFENRLAHCAAALCVIATAQTFQARDAAAHPHAWIEMRSDIVYDHNGQISALNIEWTFDKGYSAAAIDGLDTNGDGVYSSRELDVLARENLNALKEYDYFVYAKFDGEKVPYGEVTVYGQTHGNDVLTMYFSLPLQQPIDPLAGTFSYKIYDPSFYIAMDYAKDAPVSVMGKAPESCSFELKPVPIDDAANQTKQMLSEKPADWQPDPDEDFGGLFAQPVVVTCTPKAS